MTSLIREKLGFDVTIPEYLEEIILKAGAKLEEVKQPKVEKTRIDLSPLLADLKAKIDNGDYVVNGNTRYAVDFDDANWVCTSE